MKRYLQAEWPLVLVSALFLAFIAWHEFVVHRLTNYIDHLEAANNWTELTNAVATMRSGDTLVTRRPMVMVIRSNTFTGPMTFSSLEDAIRSTKAK